MILLINRITAFIALVISSFNNFFLLLNIIIDYCVDNFNCCYGSYLDLVL